MKTFEVTLSRDLGYTEEAIVTINANTEEEARELAEEDDFYFIHEQDLDWKIVNDSGTLDSVSVTEVVSEQEKLLQMPTQGIYLN
jgi:hypothetical protein